MPCEAVGGAAWSLCDVNCFCWGGCLAFDNLPARLPFLFSVGSACGLPLGLVALRIGVGVWISLRPNWHDEHPMEDQICASEISDHRAGESCEIA